MLNTQDLEKRWLRYKIKSYIPFAALILFFLVAVIVSILFFTASSSKDTKQQKKEIQKPTTKAVVKQQLHKRAQIKAPVKIDKVTQQHKVENSSALTLHPSMNFMKQLQESKTQPYYKIINTPHKQQKEKKQIKKRKKVIQQNIEEKYIDVQENKAVKEPIVHTQNIVHDSPTERHLITIERRDSQKDIKDIIARFKKNNNPALSLFVAKKYYELGNYEEAYNYALLTNNINNDIEESWLIFAKSLVKLHKKQLAIKTLQKYIQYSHSGNARVLLDEIRTGKFR